MAQRAHTCIACGASLDYTPRRRRLIVPWADLTLFAVIGGLIVLWWLRPLGGTDSQPRLALASTAVPTVELATATPATALPTSIVQAFQSQAPGTREPSSTPVPPTHTPTLTPTASHTPTAAPTAVTYKVKNGETLQVIADRFNTTVNALIQANSLGADAFIRVNQELTIPPTGGPSQPNTPAPSPTPTGGTLMYRVQEGDTISQIAERFDSSQDLILSANKLPSVDFLRIGQTLVIPTRHNATPVPTVVPTQAPATVTPTAAPRFVMPMPVSPGDNGTVGSESDVLLTWTSVGVLAESEWYVVTLQSSDGKVKIPPFWTKSTSWRLTPDYRSPVPANAASATPGSGGPVAGAASAAAVPAEQPLAEFVWQVQVVVGQPGRPGPALSPPSAPRKFTWR